MGTSGSSARLCGFSPNAAPTNMAQGTGPNEDALGAAQNGNAPLPMGKLDMTEDKLLYYRHCYKTLFYRHDQDGDRLLDKREFRLFYRDALMASGKSKEAADDIATSTYQGTERSVAVFGDYDRDYDSKISFIDFWEHPHTHTQLLPKTHEEDRSSQQFFVTWELRPVSKIRRQHVSTRPPREKVLPVAANGKKHKQKKAYAKTPRWRSSDPVVYGLTEDGGPEEEDGEQQGSEHVSPRRAHTNAAAALTAPSVVPPTISPRDRAVSYSDWNESVAPILARQSSRNKLIRSQSDPADRPIFSPATSLPMSPAVPAGAPAQTQLPTSPPQPLQQAPPPMRYGASTPSLGPPAIPVVQVRPKESTHSLSYMAKLPVGGFRATSTDFEAAPADAVGSGMGSGRGSGGRMMPAQSSGLDENAQYGNHSTETTAYTSSHSADPVPAVSAPALLQKTRSNSNLLLHQERR